MKKTKEATTAQLNSKWSHELRAERALQAQEQATLQGEVDKKKSECARLAVGVRRGDDA